jgi:hypothetical protein
MCVYESCSLEDHIRVYVCYVGPSCYVILYCSSDFRYLWSNQFMTMGFAELELLVPYRSRRRANHIDRATSACRRTYC